MHLPVKAQMTGRKAEMTATKSNDLNAGTAAVQKIPGSGNATATEAVNGTGTATMVETRILPHPTATIAAEKAGAAVEVEAAAGIARLPRNNRLTCPFVV